MTTINAVATIETAIVNNSKPFGNDVIIKRIQTVEIGANVTDKKAKWKVYAAYIYIAIAANISRDNAEKAVFAGNDKPDTKRFRNLWNACAKSRLHMVDANEWKAIRINNSIEGATNVVIDMIAARLTMLGVNNEHSYCAMSEVGDDDGVKAFNEDKLEKELAAAAKKIAAANPAAVDTVEETVAQNEAAAKPELNLVDQFKALTVNATADEFAEMAYEIALHFADMDMERLKAMHDQIGAMIKVKVKVKSIAKAA